MKNKIDELLNEIPALYVPSGVLLTISLIFLSVIVPDPLAAFRLARMTSEKMMAPATMQIKIMRRMGLDCIL